MFCEVEKSYIEDGFNLYGLRACVSNFSDCLDLILDRIGPDDSDDSHLTQSACTLYGLIHARYIITAHGLDAMYNKVCRSCCIRSSQLLEEVYVKELSHIFVLLCFVVDHQYAAKEFGTCPLVQCAGQPVLPVGLKDEMGADTVKTFCPKCQCVYHPPPVRSRSSHHGGTGAAGVDGAAFGTTFPHLFLMTFSNLVPDRLPSDSAYVPRVFGFRVHMSARQRTSSTGQSIVSSSNARPREFTDNNKRLSFARRSTESASKEAADRKQKEEDSKASTAQDGAAAAASQDAANDSNQKGNKGSGSSSKQQKPDESSNKDDDGKKSKAGKRRSEGDAASKKSDGNGNGFLDNSSKRRRKGDNGNG